MTPERELMGIEWELERRLGPDWRIQFGSAPEAVEALFRHETALYHMPRYGRKWFSDADYERLVKAAQKSLLVMQFMQTAEHICSGEDFVAFIAQVVLQAATVIEQYEKHALDVLMRHPLPHILETPDAG
jgi:hypothetical protein